MFTTHSEVSNSIIPNTPLVPVFTTHSEVRRVLWNSNPELLVCNTSLEQRKFQERGFESGRNLGMRPRRCDSETKWRIQVGEERATVRLFRPYRHVDASVRDMSARARAPGSCLNLLVWAAGGGVSGRRGDAEVKLHSPPRRLTSRHIVTLQ